MERKVFLSTEISVVLLPYFMANITNYQNVNNFSSTSNTKGCWKLSLIQNCLYTQLYFFI